MLCVVALVARARPRGDGLHGDVQPRRRRQRLLRRAATRRRAGRARPRRCTSWYAPAADVACPAASSRSSRRSAHVRVGTGAADRRGRHGPRPLHRWRLPAGVYAQDTVGRGARHVRRVAAGRRRRPRHDLVDPVGTTDDAARRQRADRRRCSRSRARADRAPTPPTSPSTRASTLVGFGGDPAVSPGVVVTAGRPRRGDRRRQRRRAALPGRRGGQRGRPVPAADRAVRARAASAAGCPGHCADVQVTLQPDRARRGLDLGAGPGDRQLPASWTSATTPSAGHGPLTLQVHAIAIAVAPMTIVWTLT